MQCPQWGVAVLIAPVCPAWLLPWAPGSYAPLFLPLPGSVPGQQQLPDPGSLKPLLHPDPPRLWDEEATAPEQHRQRPGSTGSEGVWGWGRAWPDSLGMSLILMAIVLE